MMLQSISPFLHPSICPICYVALHGMPISNCHWWGYIALPCNTSCTVYHYLLHSYNI